MVAILHFIAGHYFGAECRYDLTVYFDHTSLYQLVGFATGTDTGIGNELVQPDAIITSFSTPMESDDMMEYLSGLTTSFKGLPIYVGGIQLDTLHQKLPPGVIKFPTVTAFRDKVLKQF